MKILTFSMSYGEKVACCCLALSAGGPSAPVGGIGFFRMLIAASTMLLSVAGTAGTHQSMEGNRSGVNPVTVGVDGVAVSTLIEEVLARHPSVKQSLYEGEAAEKVVDVAKRQFYPTPSVSLEAGDSQSVRLFRLSQPVWTGGQLSGRLRVAQLRRQRASAVADDIKIKLALRVLDLCQSYAGNSRRVSAKQGEVRTLEQLTAMISRRAEAEVSSLADKRVVQARLSQAQADLQGFVVARKQAMDQIEQLLGESVDLDRLNWPSVTSDLRVLQNYIDSAMLEWPGNRIARIDELIAQEEAVVAKSAQWPTIAVLYERRGGSGLVSSGYEKSRIWVTTQYTLGAGLSSLAQADEAKLRALSAAQAVGTAERLSSDSIVVEWQTYQSAALRKVVQAEALEGTRDILESNRRLFIAGRRGWLDVVNSVRESTQAEIGKSDIETVLMASNLRLQLLTGQQIWMPSLGSK